MRLVSNWRRVLRRAWTVRLTLLCAVLNGVAVTVAIITGALPLPPVWLAILNGLLAASIPIVRLIDQNDLKE